MLHCNPKETNLKLRSANSNPNSMSESATIHFNDHVHDGNDSNIPSQPSSTPNIPASPEQLQLQTLAELEQAKEDALIQFKLIQQQLDNCQGQLNQCERELKQVRKLLLNGIKSSGTVGPA